MGDRIRLRRAWLDEWIDAGGGEVPPPPPAKGQPAAPPSLPRVVPRPAKPPAKRRSEPKPKPPTFIQRIGDKELRVLAEGARDRYARIYSNGAAALAPPEVGAN